MAAGVYCRDNCYDRCHGEMIHCTPSSTPMQNNHLSILAAANRKPPEASRMTKEEQKKSDNEIKSLATEYFTKRNTYPSVKLFCHQRGMSDNVYNRLVGFINKSSADKNVGYNGTYWDLSNVMHLFGGGDRSVIGDIEEFIGKWVEFLKSGYSSSEGWRLVLEVGDRDNLCMQHDIFNIQLKYRYISLSLCWAPEKCTQGGFCCHV